MPRFNHVILALAAIAAIFILGQQLLKDRQTQPASADLATEEPQSDYYVGNGRLLQTNEQGQRQYEVTSTHMTHHEDLDMWLLQAPTMTLFNEQNAPWYGRSEHGRIWNKGDEAELTGKVRLWREASTEQRPVTIDTRDVYLQPQDKYAETDATVVVQQEQSWLTGIGAKVYLDEQRYELLSAVRGHYVPDSN